MFHWPHQRYRHSDLLREGQQHLSHCPSSFQTSCYSNSNLPVSLMAPSRQEMPAEQSPHPNQARLRRCLILQIEVESAFHPLPHQSHLPFVFGVQEKHACHQIVLRHGRWIVNGLAKLLHSCCFGQMAKLPCDKMR